MLLDHIVLLVADIDAALGFYVDVLGLSPERVDEFRRGKVLFPSVRINADTLIDLLPVASAPASAAQNMDHLCLNIEYSHWREIVEGLPARGIEVEAGPMTLWGAHGDAIAVYIHDPDGNRVELRYYGD